MLHQKCFSVLSLLLVPCALLLLSACQSEPDEAAVPEGQCTITFSVTNYRQISFDDLGGDATRADIPSDHPSTLAHLVVAVFDAETGQQACSPIQHDYKDYEETPSDYPQFSVTLSYGHYRVLVLGYNGSKACTISSLNHISWEGDYVPNTFLYSEELTLDKDADLNREITLKRVVAAFRLTAEDAIPSELKKLRFCSTAGGTVLDALTGFTPSNTGRTSDIVVPSANVGVQGQDFTVYLFLPEEQTTSNYTVQALGANDAVLYEKHFHDVPLKVNVLTMWQGKFFEDSTPDVEAYDTGFGLYWDTKWDETWLISNP